MIHGVENVELVKSAGQVAHEDEEMLEELEEDATSEKFFGRILTRGFDKVKEFFEAAPDSDF